MMRQALVLITFLCFGGTYAINRWCYRCHSAQSGCGESLDIRLQHWKQCDNSKVPDNFCVKYVESIGGQKFVTRGCLDQFLDSTAHRTEMPMIRRHGYCIYSKTFQRILDSRPSKTIDLGVDEYKMYCFCNDWNGCNFALPIANANIVLIILSSVSFVFSIFAERL